MRWMLVAGLLVAVWGCDGHRLPAGPSPYDETQDGRIGSNEQAIREFGRTLGTISRTLERLERDVAAGATAIGILQMELDEIRGNIDAIRRSLPADLRTTLLDLDRRVDALEARLGRMQQDEDEGATDGGSERAR